MNPPSAVLGGGVHGKVCWLIAYNICLICMHVKSDKSNVIDNVIVAKLMQNFYLYFYLKLHYLPHIACTCTLREKKQTNETFKIFYPKISLYCQHAINVYVKVFIFNSYYLLSYIWNI